MKNFLVKTIKKHFKHGLTLMVVPVSSDHKIRSLRIPFATALLIICFIGFNVYIFAAYSVQIWQINQFQQKISGQDLLISKYEAEKSRVKPIIDHYQHLETELTAFRQKNDQMTDTWKRVRQKGKFGFTIASRGSFRVKNTANSYRLSPLPEVGIVTSLEKLDHNLNQLDEILRKETQSQEELYKDLKAYERYLDHTPSIWPVYTGIVGGFGMRFHPVWRRRIMHDGVDLRASLGTKVRATADGTVTFAGWQDGYGNLIIISHEYGFETRYGHNSRLLVYQGQSVKKGQVISYSGNTGVSTGPHLHYEVRINGNPVNPVPFLKD